MEDLRSVSDIRCRNYMENSHLVAEDRFWKVDSNKFHGSLNEDYQKNSNKPSIYKRGTLKLNMKDLSID